MTRGSSLDRELSKKTSVFGLKLWVLIGIGVGGLIVGILLLLSIWLSSRKKSRRIAEKGPSLVIPVISKEIKEVKVHQLRGPSLPRAPDCLTLSAYKNAEHSDLEEEVSVGYEDNSTSKDRKEKERSEASCLDERQIGKGREAPRTEDERLEMGDQANRVILDGEKPVLLASPAADNRSHASSDARSASSSAPSPAPTPIIPEVSHLGWGSWYTLRDLEAATNGFSGSNVLGQGGYGIVYRGELPDGSLIAVKNLLNNRGQAEKEFRVEVEAIGRVRHKNLVRLLGFCAEGLYRMLVYEYVDNGNLDLWLHGPLGEKNPIPWDMRMKIILGTAKGLAYLHEGLEPKVVHRDVKSSNILIDGQWNAKVSDFGLAKLLGSEKSHVTTRVMGTFGYVAPEYASTGLLNERSDVYSFGVLLMELISGRDPVDYGRPEGEVNLVDWLKVMVGSRRSEEVADPKLQVKPSPRALKRALLVALRCVDPDSEKRPKMGHVIHMLEADDFPFRDDRRISRGKDSPHHQYATALGQGISKMSPAIQEDSPTHHFGNSAENSTGWKRYAG